MSQTTIPHLGRIDATPEAAVLARATALGQHVEAGTHETLTWHDRSAIRRAHEEGRVVARFVVRYGDPECYVVRRSREDEKSAMNGALSEVQALDAGVSQVMDALDALQRLAPRARLGPPSADRDPRWQPLTLLANAVRDRIQTLMGEPSYDHVLRQHLLASDARTAEQRIVALTESFGRLSPTDIRHVYSLLRSQYPAAVREIEHA